MLLGVRSMHTQVLPESTHELGLVVGPLAFLSDYGQRYSPRTNAGNTGLGVGVVHYMSFGRNSVCYGQHSHSHLWQHLKLRSEIDYHHTNLHHYGRWARLDNEEGDKLRAMVGKARVLEAGFHLEYHLIAIRDFRKNRRLFSPFFSGGMQYVLFWPGTHSRLGPLEDNLFDQWNMKQVITGGENKQSFSVVLGTGTRYRLSTSADLVVNFQWRYYHTDWLDGLNHDLKSNKAKDHIMWLNMGYIHYLNF